MSTLQCDRGPGLPTQPPQAASVGSEAGIRDIGVTLHNVVSCFSTECHLNLKKIALEGMDVEYRPEHYMVTMRLRKPYCVASIRSSGKIFVAGSANEDDSRRGSRRIARRIQKLGFPCRFANFRVTNVHATCELPFLVRLPGIAEELPQMADYEPEIHPALNLRFKDLRVLAKVFATGSVVLTAPCTPNIDLAVMRMYPICWRHRSTNKSEAERRDYVASIRRICPRAPATAIGGGVSGGGPGAGAATTSSGGGSGVIGRPSAAKRRRLAAGGAVSASAAVAAAAPASSATSAAAAKRRRQADAFTDLSLCEEDRQVLRLLLADGRKRRRRGGGGGRAGGASASLLSDLEDNDDYASMSDSSSDENF